MRAQSASTPAPGRASDVQLGPGDIVRVQVFLEQGLASISGLDLRAPMEYDVDASGNAFIPVVGEIRVAGRAFDEVRREIDHALTGQFTSATVRVIPILRIAVLGDVRTPRLVPVDPTMTFSDVIAAVGGLTEMAARGDIRLVRGEETVMVVDSDELGQVRTPLRSGDRIVVGRRSWASQNTPFLISAGTSILVAVLTSLLLR